MKTKRLIISILLLFPVCAGLAQSVSPVILSPLPEIINESSGIEVSSLNSIWTHNDSGDLPRIFKTDTLGNLVRILNLSGVAASDIEDITQDEQGNYYIGDFGNNLNLRQDLRIYKIPDPDQVTGDSIVPEQIFFNFPDQHLFPPEAAGMNFDCEALFHFRDSLYLFSKNRGVSTFSRMYRLPDQPGIYTAELVDSFNTIKWITSADISPNGKSMVLLSYDLLWLFTSIKGTDFLHGQALKLTMDSTQKEGIVFVNNTEVYLTDERFMGIGGNLYKLDLKQYIDGIDESPDVQQISVSPNPSSGEIKVTLNLSSQVQVRIELLNTAGQKIMEENRNLVNGTNEITLHLPENLSGLYFLRILLNGSHSVTRKIVIKKEK